MNKYHMPGNSTKDGSKPVSQVIPMREEILAKMKTFSFWLPLMAVVIMLQWIDTMLIRKKMELIPTSDTTGMTKSAMR